MYYELKTSRVSAEALLDYLYETRISKLKNLYVHKGQDEDQLKIIHNDFVEDSFIYNAVFSSLNTSMELGFDDVEVLLSYMDLDLYKAKMESYLYRLNNIISDMRYMGLNVFREVHQKGHIECVLHDLNNAEEIEGITIEDFELNN